MAEITVFVKNSAKNKEVLDTVEKPDPQSGNTLKIVKERIPQEPIISRAPLGPETLHAAEQIIRQYFTAEGLIVITITGVIGNAAYDFLKSLVKKSITFLSSNNKQKGNAWGAKVELRRDLEGGQVQIVHFFLDNISESKLFDSISKIQTRFDHLSELMGVAYMKQLRHIGFSFSDLKDDWEIIGVEKFDGSVDLLS